MTSARAVWFERPGVATLRTEPIATPGPDEILVRTLRSGVSAGTERIVLIGDVPSEARAAMALPTMRGGFELPISYGYAAVGVVEQPAASAAWPRLGDRVFALHPHHDRFVIRADAVRSLPTGVEPDRLVLAPSVETAVNVVWDAEVALGDRVVVTGLGVVGLLAGWLAGRTGASVVGVDPDPERRALAEPLGVRGIAPEGAAASMRDADSIVECSGNPEALAQAVARAGAGARVVVASWFGARAVSLPLGGTFHPHRVTLQSSQVATVAPHRRRWNAERRWALVCDLLAEPVLDRLLAPAVTLADAPAVYAELAAGTRWNPPQRVFDATR